MDYGRRPIARFPSTDFQLSEETIDAADIKSVLKKVFRLWIKSPLIYDKVGGCSKDKRAGINGTLHSVSCILNRSEQIVGLTGRVGRHVPVHSEKIDEFAKAGKSILFLGNPFGTP